MRTGSVVLALVVLMGACGGGSERREGVQTPSSQVMHATTTDRVGVSTTTTTTPTLADRSREPDDAQVEKRKPGSESVGVQDRITITVIDTADD